MANDLELLMEQMQKPDLRFIFPPETDRPPLKMSYGLEMDLRRMLPSPDIALNLLLGDPWTQDYIVRRCLTDKQHLIVDDKELIPAEEVNLDSETIEKLLMWAAEHALYFFAKRTAGLANLGNKFEGLLKEKVQTPPSSNGSEDSPSTTPSVGDSTA